MRTIAIASLLLFATSCATPTASPENVQKLTSVTEFPGLSDDTIFKRAMEFIARTYTSANDVIQLSDPTSGKIIAKGVNFSAAKWDLGIKRPFSYTLVIDIKPGKLRAKYENIETISLNGTGGPDLKYQWNSVQESINNTTNRLTSFVRDNKSDDW